MKLFNWGNSGDDKTKTKNDTSDRRARIASLISEIDQEAIKIVALDEEIAELVNSRPMRPFYLHDLESPRQDEKGQYQQLRGLQELSEQHRLAARLLFHRLLQEMGMYEDAEAIHRLALDYARKKFGH